MQALHNLSIDLHINPITDLGSITSKRKQRKLKQLLGIDRQGKMMHDLTQYGSYYRMKENSEEDFIE